jgi:hypothetical protein
LGVGPGDRSEPLLELGWEPLGETTGLEPLRPKILMMATARRGCSRGQSGELLQMENAEPRPASRGRSRRSTNDSSSNASARFAGASGREQRLGHPWTAILGQRNASPMCKPHTCDQSERRSSTQGSVEEIQGLAASKRALLQFADYGALGQHLRTLTLCIAQRWFPDCFTFASASVELRRACIRPSVHHQRGPQP